MHHSPSPASQRVSIADARRRWLAAPAPSGMRTVPSLIASIVFLAVLLSLAWLAGSHAMAVYALAFWHYVLYALAYRHGAVPLPVFKRDAVLMKGASLLALGSAYVAGAPDPLSLAVVAAGFLLNALAASVLGSDRTYYGYEVAGLPRLRITRFPYSVIPHPMLVGNMLAYGGLLLDPAFRADWWPLACAHVALNLGLLVMERHVSPLRLAAADQPQARRPAAWPRRLAIGGAGLAAGLVALAGAIAVPLAAAFGLAVALYCALLHAAYVAPATRSGALPANPTETSP